MTPSRRALIDARIHASRKARKSKNAVVAAWRDIAYDLHDDLVAAEALIFEMERDAEEAAHRAHGTIPDAGK